MVDVAELLRTAHDARQRQDWPAAYERFTTARLVTTLSAEDLAVLSDVAWWLGGVDVIASGVDRPRAASHAACGCWTRRWSPSCPRSLSPSGPATSTANSCPPAKSWRI